MSDDMEWVRKHMRRKLRKEFNIFLASNKDDMHPDAIGNMVTYLEYQPGFIHQNIHFSKHYINFL